MAQREARKAKTRPTSPDILWHYEPPINLKMYSKEYVKALTRDGNLDAFLDSQGHSPLRNSINLPVVHKGSSLRAASKLRLTVPTPYALPIQSPMPSGETLPGQELAEAILSPLKPTGNGDPPEGSQQEDEAPDRPYEPFANPSNTSGSTPNHHSAATRGSLIDLGRLAKKAEPLGATLAAEELGLEQLMAAELAVPYVKASEVGMMRPEDVRGLWDQLVPLAGIDVHDPGGRARGAGASNISLPVRSPSHSPRGSPRVSPSRSSPIRTLWDSYGGVRTSAAREPRDDILDAVELGIPLCALAGRKPLELLTVLRPKTTTVNSRSSSKAPPPGRTNSRPSTLRSHKQPPLVCDPIMTTEELGHGSESLSRLAAAGRASMLGAPSGLLSSPSSRGPTPRTRRPDMTAALQADRQVRVQAPEGTALTDAQARDLLQQAEDEHAERGSLNTFYASHFKPRALVWTLDSSLRHTARVSDPPGSGDQAGIKAKPPSTTAMLARSRASLGRRFNY